MSDSSRILTVFFLTKDGLLRLDFYFLKFDYILGYLAYLVALFLGLKLPTDITVGQTTVSSLDGSS